MSCDCVSAGASGAEVRPGVSPGHEPHEGTAGLLGVSHLDVVGVDVQGVRVIWP